MFSDSKIAAQFTCGETKTASVTGCLGRYYEKKVIEEVKRLPFTLMIDESTDTGDKVSERYTLLLFKENYFKI